MCSYSGVCIAVIQQSSRSWPVEREKNVIQAMEIVCPVRLRRDQYCTPSLNHWMLKIARLGSLTREVFSVLTVIAI